MHTIRAGFAVPMVAAAVLLVFGAPAADAASRDWHETVRQFAKQHLKSPAWGYSHSVRDYRVARQLAAEDGVALDDDVLYAAAYLHDMAAFAPYEKPDVDHADEDREVRDRLRPAVRLRPQPDARRHVRNDPGGLRRLVQEPPGDDSRRG